MQEWRTRQESSWSVDPTCLRTIGRNLTPRRTPSLLTDGSKQVSKWAIPHSHVPNNSPAYCARPLTCGVPSECLGTRSYETTSRDQRGKIEMFFSSTGACTTTKSLIANHHSPIVTQLYFASVTQMFLMPLFVKVESDSSKLLRTVSKSGPNGCKERSRPQKMIMRIKI